MIERSSRILALAALATLVTPLFSVAAADAPAPLGKTAASTPHAVTPRAQQPGASVTVTGTGQTRIDGTPAATGATLFSGSRIATEKDTSATVTIGGAHVTLAPSTDAVVTFSASSV